MKRKGSDVDELAKKYKPRVRKQDPAPPGWEEEAKGFQATYLDRKYANHWKKTNPKMTDWGFGNRTTYAETLHPYLHVTELKYNAGVHELVKKIIEEARELFSITANSAAVIARQSNSFAVTKPPDGEFCISFISVGSGDCILLRTPAGNVIAIDCGTRSRNEEAPGNIEQRLKSFGALESNAGLAALILTHPDKDHHKDVSSLLFKKKGMLCQNVFYSLDIGMYTTGNTKSTIEKMRGAFRSQVTIDDEEVKLHDAEGSQFRVKQGEHSIQIAGFDTTAGFEETKLWDERYCEVHLLAAGIGAKAEDIDPNPASIVTFIKVHGRKILLTGDAEISTEKFLKAKHGPLIKEVDLLQAAHHGSGSKLHADHAFIEHVNPYIVAVSSGTMDYNPRGKLLGKFTGKGARLCARVEPHGVLNGTTGKWNAMEADQHWGENNQRAIYSTFSSGDLTFTIDKAGNIKRYYSVDGKPYLYQLDKKGVCTKFSVDAHGLTKLVDV